MTHSERVGRVMSSFISEFFCQLLRPSNSGSHMYTHELSGRCADEAQTRSSEHAARDREFHRINQRAHTDIRPCAGCCEAGS
jgi:hypothetical protein